MLKIYSSCCLLGSCQFSGGVGNNNGVNFLFFPFELSACMCNNVLVSATAGEKCDTDISLLRYDSPEICAYGSNQNSDPQLTSACAALSAPPQSAGMSGSGQWYQWLRGRCSVPPPAKYFSNQTLRHQQETPRCHNPAVCLD